MRIYKIAVGDEMNGSYVTLDARGLNCPMPVIKAKKTLKEQVEIGEVLEIIASDPGSMNDIPAWTRTTKQELISADEISKKEFRFLVRRRN